jgi:hypothetical protein
MIHYILENPQVLKKQKQNDYSQEGKDRDGTILGSSYQGRANHSNGLPCFCAGTREEWLLRTRSQT